MVRIDTGGRDPSVTTYLWRGAAFFAVCVLVLVLLMMRYQGKFDDTTRVTAQLNDVGDGLISGADVRYNGFIVGAVDTIESTGGSSATVIKNVRIDLDTQQAKGIPSNITARTVPANLFGVNSVELIQPAQPENVGLRSGAEIPADKTLETVRLQDAQNDLRNLLKAVPAEDLGMVLGTLSDALRGGGSTFKTFLPVLDTYFKQLNAQFPAGAPSGFDNYNDALQGLSASTPKLLDTLGKAVVPSMTIAEHERDLTALLSAGQGMIDTTQVMFAKNGDGGKRLVGDLNRMLGATMADPDAMPQAVRELYILAGRVLGVFTGVNGKVQLNLGLSFTPFEMYGRQNCPVYDGGKYGQLRGPGCVGPGTGTGPTMSGPLSIYPSDGMVRRKVNAQVTTGRDDATLGQALGRKPSTAESMMLGPLVSGVTPAPKADDKPAADKPGNGNAETGNTATEGGGR